MCKQHNTGDNNGGVIMVLGLAGPRWARVVSTD